MQYTHKGVAHYGMLRIWIMLGAGILNKPATVCSAAGAATSAYSIANSQGTGVQVLHVALACPSAAAPTTYGQVDVEP